MAKCTQATRAHLQSSESLKQIACTPCVLCINMLYIILQSMYLKQKTTRKHSRRGRENDPWRLRSETISNNTRENNIIIPQYHTKRQVQKTKQCYITNITTESWIIQNWGEYDATFYSFIFSNYKIMEHYSLCRTIYIEKFCVIQHLSLFTAEDITLLDSGGKMRTESIK